MPKINLTGDSWDFLRGLVRDTATEGAAGGPEKKPNGATHSMSDDDGDDNEDGDELEPTEDYKKWRNWGREQNRRAGKYRIDRNEARRALADEQKARAADKAKLEADLAALRTESDNARTAAVAEATKKGDQRLIRIELKRALTEAKCQDVDAALQIVDASPIKVTEAGDVEGVSDVLAALKKDKAYLFGAASTTNTQTGAPAEGDKKVNVKEMSADEYKAYKRTLGLK